MSGGIAVPEAVAQQQMLAELNRHQAEQQAQIPTKVEQQRIAAVTMAVNVITSGRWLSGKGTNDASAGDVVHLADKINKFLVSGAV